MKKIILFLSLILAFSSGVLLAEESHVLSLSLEEALQIAYRENPDILQAIKEISASKGKRIHAEALPDPEAEISIGGFKKNEEGERKEKIDSFAIKQPLDPLGTRFLRGAIAKDEVKISIKNLELVWSEVKRRVTVLYAQILADEKAREIAEENLNVTRQFFTRVETRFQSGSALQSDVIRSKIEIARAENELLIAEKNLKVSKGEMNLLLGKPAENQLALKDALVYEALNYEYGKIKEEALNHRSEVRIETARVNQAKKGFQSALLKTIFPKMSIGVERTTEEFENDTALILEGSYPLWGFNLGDVKTAKAEKEKQLIRLDALKRQIGLEVYEAFLEAELANKQVLLQKKALDEANELLRQITLQYESGEVPFLTYLENIKTIKETRLAYFNILKTYNERIAALERAIRPAAVPEGVKK